MSYKITILMNQFLITSLNSFSKIVITHSQAIKSGIINDIFVANNILNAYSRCHHLHLARKLFDVMPHRDTVSWNTIIAANVKSGNFDLAWDTLTAMKRSELELDGHTFGALLKAVALSRHCELGQQLHSEIIKTGLAENVYCGSSLLDMYAKCGRTKEAFEVFEDMSERNVVSWNALISCSVQVGDRGTAISLLSCMESEGLKIDDGSVAPLLTLFDDFEFYKLTMQVHGKVVKHGLEFENKVCNAVISSYSECGSINDAKRVFDHCTGTRDLVTWNSMIGAYLVHDLEDCAFGLFVDMQRLGFEPDIYSYTSIISACSEQVHKNHGKSLHGLVIKRGLRQSCPVSNALMAMYLNSNGGSMIEALDIFGSLQFKDRVSWNSILTGLSQTGSSEDALKLFMRMRYEALDLDDYTFSAVLRSCSDLATLRLGKLIHALALKSGFGSNEFVISSLIFMYAKCGIIEDARYCFEENTKHGSVAWNSIIFAYAQHGKGDVALDLFSQMKKNQVKLDHITFVAVLTACSHIGLVNEGQKIFNSMEKEQGITPKSEHYACLVDLYGRAGKLEKAKALIESMPFEPDSMVLKTFLGACRACGNVELACQVAGYLLDVDPADHCTYILLSDLYGHLGRWNERADVKMLMRQRGVKKVPGWSWIEIQNEVHAFKAEDRVHHKSEAIYFMLLVIIDDLRRLDDGSDDDDDGLQVLLYG